MTISPSQTSDANTSRVERTAPIRTTQRTENRTATHSRNDRQCASIAYECRPGEWVCTPGRVLSCHGFWPCSLLLTPQSSPLGHTHKCQPFAFATQFRLVTDCLLVASRRELVLVLVSSNE